MVILFESNIVSPSAKIYMGVDKHENEHLIRWGWPEDVWFHVDKLSSAHVYLRLENGHSNLDEIPPELIGDCAQLVKANSIQGNKMANIDVVYTMWSNLDKTGEMAVGQVGFKDGKSVKKVRVEKRINEVINRLNKTKKEIQIDYGGERDERDRKKREARKTELKERQKLEAEEQRREEERRREYSYDRLMSPENMVNNSDNDSDDFM